jgi:hypothetical protein
MEVLKWPLLGARQDRGQGRHLHGRTRQRRRNHCLDFMCCYTKCGVTRTLAGHLE